MNKWVIISVSIFTFCFIGCSKLVSPEDVMIDTTFKLEPPEGLEVEQVNFVLDLNNVNTKEKIHKGSIDTFTFNLSIIRGLYIIHVDGVALVRKNGELKRVRLRGYVENHLLLDPSGTCIIHLYSMN